MKALRTVTATLVCFAVALPVPAQVQPPAAAASSAAPAPAAGAKTFSQEELDQLLAPVALYPDALLAQVLMASTYPLEIVAAERWVKANPSLKDKALEDALQKQSWDPSVKSLTVFPQVLTMMSEKIDWTQKLGDAFLAQQKDVMATAQSLRAKAAAQGALKDSKEQKVITEKEGSTTVIKIEPADPQVVYVPTYNPTVVYGPWPYPAYPPYYWYPPGYAVGGAFLGFTAGIIVGGALWGGCNWGRGDVNINVNRYNNFNRTNISNGNWNHDAGHRGSVPYRDKAVAQQHGRGQAGDAASREAFRGHADAGRESIQRGEVPRDAGTRDAAGSRDAGGRDSAGTRDTGGRDAASTRDAGGRDAAGTRDAGGRDAAGSRDTGGADRSGTRNATAFDTSRGAQTASASSRGASSMGSARASGNMSGGARAGGGGGRGGGGRR